MAEERRSAGRPRDEKTKAAILAAALKLTARDGYAKLTVDGIAGEAGVGKQTLYRWWPTGKAAVVLEAFAEDASDRVHVEPTGDWAADLAEFLGQVCARLSARAAGTVFRSLLAEALLDAAFAKAFLAAYLDGRIADVRAILARSGAPADRVDRVVELAYGTIWYRIATRAPLDAATAADLVELARGMLEAPARRGRRARG